MGCSTHVLLLCDDADGLFFKCGREGYAGYLYRFETAGKARVSSARFTTHGLRCTRGVAVGSDVPRWGSVAGTALQLGIQYSQVGDDEAGGDDDGIATPSLLPRAFLSAYEALTSCVAVLRVDDADDITSELVASAILGLASLTRIVGLLVVVPGVSKPTQSMVDTLTFGVESLATVPAVTAFLSDREWRALCAAMERRSTLVLEAAATVVIRGRVYYNDAMRDRGVTLDRRRILAAIEHMRDRVDTSIAARFASTGLDVVTADACPSVARGDGSGTGGGGGGDGDGVETAVLEEVALELMDNYAEACSLSWAVVYLSSRNESDLERACDDSELGVRTQDVMGLLTGSTSTEAVDELVSIARDGSTVACVSDAAADESLTVMQFWRRIAEQGTAAGADPSLTLVVQRLTSYLRKFAHFAELDQDFTAVVRRCVCAPPLIALPDCGSACDLHGCSTGAKTQTCRSLSSGARLCRRWCTTRLTRARAATCHPS